MRYGGSLFSDRPMWILAEWTLVNSQWALLPKRDNLQMFPIELSSVIHTELTCINAPKQNIKPPLSEEWSFKICNDQYMAMTSLFHPSTLGSLMLRETAQMWVHWYSAHCFSVCPCLSQIWVLNIVWPPNIILFWPPFRSQIYIYIYVCVCSLCFDHQI